MSNASDTRQVQTLPDATVATAVDNRMKRELCVLFFALLTWTQAGKDYCSITCFGRMHTMCAYKEIPGPGCKDFKTQRLSEEEKALIVRKHNELRNQVAVGNQVPQPPASNMMQLQWDDELGDIAQRWADQCNFAHDECRDTSKGNWVGQNIASSGKSSHFQAQLEYHIMRWFDEVNYTEPSVVKCFPDMSDENFPKIGHYTQMVYAETKYIGCGRSFYILGRMYKELLVCNYKPGGNIRNRPLYVEGIPCSKCPGGTTCSATYRGLCTANKQRQFLEKQEAVSGSTIQSIKISNWPTFLVVLVSAVSKL